MCLFCIAVFAVLAGAVTSAVLDSLEQKLQGVAENEQVKRVSDTGSTAVFTLDVPVPDVPGQPAASVRTAPVAVTVFKAQKRVRIQVRTHAVTAAQAEAIQDRVAAATGLTVVSRSSEQTRHTVREAVSRLTEVPDAPGTAYVGPQAPARAVNPGRAGWARSRTRRDGNAVSACGARLADDSPGWPARRRHRRGRTRDSRAAGSRGPEQGRQRS